MAYDPYQRFTGYTPPPMGGGAVGEFGRFGQNMVAPATGFQGFSLPASVASLGDISPRQTSAFQAGAPQSLSDIMGSGGIIGSLPSFIRNRIQSTVGQWSPIHTPPQIALELLTGRGPQTEGPLGRGGLEAILDMLRRQGIEQGVGFQNRARLAAETYAPERVGNAILGANMQSQSDLSRALSGATSSYMQNYQQFLQELLKLMLGGSYSRIAAEAQPKQGIDWGSIGGGAGALIGALPLRNQNASA